MSVFAEVAKWLRAVGRHWQALVTGSSITVASACWEHWHGVPVSWWLYSLFLTFTFMIASFSAWCDEHRAKLELEKRTKRRPLLLLQCIDSRLTLENRGELDAFL
jgi:hypothetical protein